MEWMRGTEAQDVFRKCVRRQEKDKKIKVVDDKVGKERQMLEK